MEISVPPGNLILVSSLFYEVLTRPETVGPDAVQSTPSVLTAGQPIGPDRFLLAESKTYVAKITGALGEQDIDIVSSLTPLIC